MEILDVDLKKEKQEKRRGEKRSKYIYILKKTKITPSKTRTRQK